VQFLGVKGTTGTSTSFSSPPSLNTSTRLNTNSSNTTSNTPATDPVVLLLGGVDLLDGTPILDISPYNPTTDCIPHATASDWSNAAPTVVPVVFAPAASHQLVEIATASSSSVDSPTAHPWKATFRELILQILQQVRVFIAQPPAPWGDM
jgi:hypothetical protein